MFQFSFLDLIQSLFSRSFMKKTYGLQVCYPQIQSFPLTGITQINKSAEEKWRLNIITKSKGKEQIVIYLVFYYVLYTPAQQKN